MSGSKQLPLRLTLPPPEPARVRLPDVRKAVTHKFVIRGGETLYKEVTLDDGRILYEQVMVDLDGYVTIGQYSDGSPGEIFLTVGKAGGVWKAYDALMVAISIGLQYGIPLDVFIEKFANMKFEPSGMTSNPAIPLMQSIPDYLARWLRMRFPPTEDQEDQMEGKNGSGRLGKGDTGGEK